MDNIKSFIYLDTNKMYSLSAQLFEGLTETIINKQSEGQTVTEEQKGEVFSGRIIGDILKKETEKTELKFLHDYAYTIFEDKILNSSKVITLAKQTDVTIDEIENYSFIKVTGYPSFNDVKMIRETLSQFNEFGEALQYITTFEDRNSELTKLNDELWEAQSKDKKRQIKNKIERLKDVREKAMEKGLVMDEDFMKKLAFTLMFGYKDSFEIKYILENLAKPENKIVITGVINREYLKEKEDLIIKKFSRYSSKSITLLGIISQTSKEKIQIQNSENVDFSNMKEAIDNVTASLSDVENTFIGKLDNEIIIDPIAVYQEIL